MNINKLQIGQKVRAINPFIPFYFIEKVLKSRVWLKLIDEKEDLNGRVFKNIKPSSILEIL